MKVEPSFESAGFLKALLNDSLGAMFIGMILSAILLGITNAQVFVYFRSSVKDHTCLRVMIAFLWCLSSEEEDLKISTDNARLLDAVQIGLLASYLYYIMVTNFSNLFIIGKVTGSLCVYLILSGLNDFIIRIFYSRRVWFVSDGNMILTAMMLCLSATTFAFGLSFSIKLFSMESFLQVSQISWLRYAAFSSDVIVDFVCAISLLYFLRKGKNGRQRTDTVVNKLTLYVISTGLLTSLVATASFVTYVSMPKKAIFAAIFPCLSKLYFSALLATLNARKQLREDLENEQSELESVAYPMPHIVHVENLCGSEHSISSDRVHAK